MCTHKRLVYNRYSRKSVLVNCGKCHACIQDRANRRAQRIRNNVSDGTLALFITLTYANDYVPYVLKSDLQKPDLEIPVYRNAEVRFVFSTKNGLRKKVTKGISLIDTVYLPTELRTDFDLYKLKSLHGLSNDFIGVCMYSDVQKFFKRLRIILHRKYHYEKNFSFYACTEYGGITQRPHIHGLLFIGQDDEETFRHAVLEAWSYADSGRTAKYIEIAKDVSSYLASYVNSNSRLSSCLQDSPFKQKHSYSKHFGLCLDAFNLNTILAKIEQGDLHYYSRKKFDGTSSLVSLPIPEYVLSRYFPKFTGINWLSSSQLRDILLKPEKIGFYLGDYEKCIIIHNHLSRSSHSLHIYTHKYSQIDNPVYKLSPKETYQIYVRLENCYQKYHAECGRNRFDYALDYVRCWRLHASNVLSDSHKNIRNIIEYKSFYTNANELCNGLVSAPTLDSLDSFMEDYNAFPDVVSQTLILEHLYDLKTKQKDVTNFCMSHSGHLV